jgi:hypothetical protein
MESGRRERASEPQGPKVRGQASSAPPKLKSELAGLDLQPEPRIIEPAVRHEV